MAKVASSKGGFVNVEFVGVAETKRMLEAKSKEILKDIDIGLLKAGNFIQQEVQESVAGNRAEPKSVESGKLANSISIKSEGDMVIIFPGRQYYSNGTTTEDVALWMEYGTSKGIYPRAHFKNTRLRNENKVKDIIEAQINRKV